MHILRLQLRIEDDRVAGSLSRVSHAMLYIGQGRVVEAIDEGVTIRSLQSAISTGRPAVAYRRNGLSGGGAERVAQWARDREDARYDLAGRGSPLLLPSHHPGLRGGR